MTAHQPAAITRLAIIAALIAIGVGAPSQLAKAALSRIQTLSRSPGNNGPFYFWRGADMRPVAQPTARTQAEPVEEGMVVERVEAGSPAAAAGLKAGDIVAALDGMPVATARSLALAIADHCCGPTVALSVWRGDHRREIELPPAGAVSPKVATRG
jgi:S1-C subfamily serine protease